jgi:death on curing protein
VSFQFLSTEEVLYIHQAETELAGHNSNVRDLNLVESAVENTRQLYANGYVTDLFDLAASYIRSLTMNHPFIDGNKRTALATALVFLEINGCAVNEASEVELADKVLDFIEKKFTEKEFADYLRINAQKTI